MTNIDKTPRSEDILKVINNFKAVVKPRGWLFKSSKGRLDMKETRVNARDHKCGSIHCHGGWYAIASGIHIHAIVRYEHGAEKMAEDLGFAGSGHLARWAAQNVGIWGNHFGVHMFSSPLAFSSPTRENGADSLQDIIKHWEEVYQRVRKIEIEIEKRSKPPVYNDITNQIAKLPVEETPDKVDVRDCNIAGKSN